MIDLKASINIAEENNLSESLSKTADNALGALTAAGNQRQEFLANLQSSAGELCRDIAECIGAGSGIAQGAQLGREFASTWALPPVVGAAIGRAFHEHFSSSLQNISDSESSGIQTSTIAQLEQNTTQRSENIRPLASPANSEDPADCSGPQNMRRLRVIDNMPRIGGNSGFIDLPTVGCEINPQLDGPEPSE